MLEKIPTVTIIIPNYNHARYLPQRIDSVLQQSYQDFEVLLLDDCSPDNSRDILEAYAARDARIKLVFNEQNSGSTFKQWNKGINLATGKYIWIAESDDAAELDFLATLVPLLEADNSVVLAYSNSFDIDEENKILKTWDWFLTELDTMWSHDFIVEGKALIQRFMSYRNIIPNASSVVMRADTLREVGPADETYRVCGDWIFWANLISRGKVAYVAKPLNYFRSHRNNARSKNEINGTNLEETSRVPAMMRAYGAPDAQFYNKAVEEILDKWYLAWLYRGLPWSRHKAIFQHLATVEPALASRVLKTASRKFFARGNGLRILLGDRLLYRVFKKKSAS